MIFYDNIDQYTYSKQYTDETRWSYTPMKEPKVIVCKLCERQVAIENETGNIDNKYCNHEFHLECLNLWYTEIGYYCPICDYKSVRIKTNKGRVFQFIK
ncbi:hypothetical protein B4U80_14020 [Leptotrombidium deliense]|uniref:RING-type domain-containing protein n=1 Tax=Leptotrombidium deliense TaxID=299467 RepID=A0A443S4U8_9ACAR|nr:hypothetical protein B4U80_14020 [Leptotrombidium deliense]